MQSACSLCGRFTTYTYTYYSPSRGYSCFECDLEANHSGIAEFAKQNLYAHSHPCTKCHRMNTRPVRYPLGCCEKCAEAYRLTFDVYVTDSHRKIRHQVTIGYEKTVGMLARKVSRFGGGIEYKGVVYDPAIPLRDLGVTPGDDFIFYGIPDEYIDVHADH